MKFLDKVAIITGGGSGIGAATARKMAKEGAKLCWPMCIPATWQRWKRK